MTTTLLALAAGPVQLTPARSQMGFTLAFHILLVPLGVALPTIMLIANYKGIKHGDAAALTLARRWSHAAALTFAVGAVTGTVLSFEFGLLWPNFTRVFGDVFGLPFAIEGISFFLEALLVAIYIYGWRRMKPWTHFWFGFPIPFVAIIGATSIISVNSWMNAPAGFSLNANGRPTKIDPLSVMFNNALPWELTHFLIAAYMAASFTVASVYVVGWLRGRRDRYHRLGILIPFTIGAILAPIQLVVGDQIARWVYQNQPAKFAAMEIVTKSGTDQAEYLFGIYHPGSNTVTGGIKIPLLDSILAGGSTQHVCRGPGRDSQTEPGVERDTCALRVRHHGADRHPARLAHRLLRDRVLAAPGCAAWPDLPMGRGRGRRPGVRRDGMRLGHHGGRPAAVDRVQHRPYVIGGDHRTECHGNDDRDLRSLRLARRRHHRGAPSDGYPMAAHAGHRRRRGTVWSAPRGRGGGPGNGGRVDG